VRGCEPNEAEPTLFLPQRSKETGFNWQREIALENGREGISKGIHSLDIVMELGMKNISAEFFIIMKSVISTRPDGEGIILECANSQSQMMGSGWRGDSCRRGEII
jgi:hypothetical protein